MEGRIKCQGGLFKLNAFHCVCSCGSILVRTEWVWAGDFHNDDILPVWISLPEYVELSLWFCKEQSCRYEGSSSSPQKKPFAAIHYCTVGKNSFHTDSIYCSRKAANISFVELYVQFCRHCVRVEFSISMHTFRDFLWQHRMFHTLWWMKPQGLQFTMYM